MPHLTLPIGPLGPTLDVLIGVSKPRAQALAAAGQPVPEAKIAHVLIDTGASCTCIDAGVLTVLGIPPSGVASVRTPSTGPTPHTTLQYDVWLTLMHSASSRWWSETPVVEAVLAPQGIMGPIGRDLLGHCLFLYDGPANHYILAF